MSRRRPPVPLAEADRLRTALLSAVSHDLRTPLASAKAAVDSLRSRSRFTDADRDELLATADESLDRLTRLVENLLDMSRLQAGALGCHPHRDQRRRGRSPAPSTTSAAGRRRAIHVPDDLPEVRRPRPAGTHPGQPPRQRRCATARPTQPPMITASEHGGRVEIRIIDHGPGIPAADRERVFLPFQRLGDRDNATGVGLGLALSRGLAEAMGGTLTPRHPRRRTDHDSPCPPPNRAIATRPPARRPRCSGRPFAPARAHGDQGGTDPDPHRRRRTADPASAAHQPAGPPVRRDHRRQRRRSPARRRRPIIPTWSCSTSACPTSTASRSSASCAPGPRSRSSSCPDASNSSEKVDALDAGADDYVTKPFNLDELLARIRAVSRRLGSPAAEQTVDGRPVHRRSVRPEHRGGDGHPHLTPTEWQLLDILLRNPGKLVSQRQLLQGVWGPTYTTETHYLRQYMKHLRRKLEADPTRPRHLLTEPGMGYRFQP